MKKFFQILWQKIYQVLTITKDKQMQIHLQHEIKQIFDEYESFVISIKGDWGSGKTYFWNKFVENSLNDDVKYAYVSLFGKESIEDIKRDVIFQISLKDKHLSTFKEKLSSIKTTLGFREDDSSFGVSGAVLGSLMSLFEKKDFENVVVCLDDFERRSESLSIKEILGYISVLKEKYNCQIVLILNEEKITDEDDVYKDYKEKIVDFEYTFTPIVDECYKIVERELKDYHDIFLDYCKSVGLNNIRVMKRVVRLLNKIYVVLHREGYREGTIEKFINEVLFFSITSYRFGFNDFEKLEVYLTKKRMNSLDENKSLSLNEEYEQIIDRMNLSPFFYLDMIDKIIIKYLETSILDIELIREELAKLDKNHEEAKIKDDFFHLEEDFLYDLGSVPGEYVKKVYSFLDAHRKDIFRLTTFDNYMFFLKQLIELDKVNEERYKELLQKTAYEFVDYAMDLEDDKYLDFKDPMTNVHIFDRFKEEIPEIALYIEEKISKKKIASYDCDKLLKTIQDIDERSGWGLKEEEFLNSASKEFFKQCCQKPIVLESITQFLRHQGKHTAFEQMKKTMLEVFDELESENINGNGYKIKRIKYLAGIRPDEVQ